MKSDRPVRRARNLSRKSFTFRGLESWHLHCDTGSAMPLTIDLRQLLKDVMQIGVALASERDLPALLDLIVTEARRFIDFQLLDAAH